MINDKTIIIKLTNLIGEGMEIYNTGAESPLKFSKTRAIGWKYSCMNLLKLRFGIKSTQYKSFVEVLNGESLDTELIDKYNLKVAIHILISITKSLEEGFVDDLFWKQEMLVFSDILEQAYEFKKKGLLLASAIYGRVILETTIKEYAEKNGIPITPEMKFDKIIIDLRLKEIIDKPFENSLRANYEIGTWATHGDEKFKTKGPKDIEEYLNFIRDKVLILK